MIKTLQREFAALNWNPSTNKILSNILTYTRVNFHFKYKTAHRKSRHISSDVGYETVLERMKKMMWRRGDEVLQVEWDEAFFLFLSIHQLCSYIIYKFIICLILRDVSLSWKHSQIYTGFSASITILPCI